MAHDVRYVQPMEHTMNGKEESFQQRSSKVLEGVEYGPKQLLTVTDTEILALDGPDAHRVTPLLSLGPGVSDQQRTMMVDEAAKRLFETGRTEDGSPVGDETTPEPTVRTVLRLRRFWLTLVSIDQTTALGRQFVTIYLRADRRALTEVATMDGRHQFSVMTRAAALDAAAEILTPFVDANDVDGDGRAYPIESWEAEARDVLATAKVAATVISRRQNRAMDRRAEDRFALYNFDDRTEVLAPETAERIRIAPVARRTLRRRLEDITRPLDAEYER